jgi:hypothetical protein
MPPHSYDAQKTGEGCKLAELIHPALRVRIARRRYAMAGRGNLRNFDWDRGVWTTPARQGWRSWRHLRERRTSLTLLAAALAGAGLVGLGVPQTLAAYMGTGGTCEATGWLG